MPPFCRFPARRRSDMIKAQINQLRVKNNPLITRNDPHPTSGASVLCRSRLFARCVRIASRVQVAEPASIATRASPFAHFPAAVERSAAIGVFARELAAIPRAREIPPCNRDATQRQIVENSPGAPADSETPPAVTQCRYTASSQRNRRCPGRAHPAFAGYPPAPGQAPADCREPADRR
jgi:hypothetical protein